MQKYIRDQGWSDAGIYDIDGSIADLRAIPYAGKTPTTEILIKPIDRFYNLWNYCKNQV